MWGEDDKDLQQRKAAALLELLVIEEQYLLLLKQLTLDVMEGKVQAQEAAERFLIFRQAHTLPQQEATNKLFKFLYYWSGASLDMSFDKWRARLQISIRPKEPDNGV